MHRAFPWLAAALLLAVPPVRHVAAATHAAPAPPHVVADPVGPVVHHRVATVNGVRVAYREAGPAGAPVVVLLHGFPASSHMYRELIPRLADRWRVIAPDYPGFGASDMPSPERYAYTFANLATTVNGLLQQLGAERYVLYIMDYGAPVGLRLALQHPERVRGLIVQDGNAYDEGIGAFWDPFKAFWASRTPETEAPLRGFLEPAAQRWQFLHGVRDSSRIAPENWTLAQAGLDRPGNKEIQLALFHDYRTNVALYPQFHAYFQAKQPPTLVVWGKGDDIFLEPGAHAFKRDLPRAEVHVLDTGHFALEEKGAEIAALIRDFLQRTVPPGRRSAKR